MDGRRPFRAGRRAFRRALERGGRGDGLRLDEPSARTADRLEIGWDTEPASLANVGFGSRWALERCSAILLVPSVIVPEETNALVNPTHPEARRITARKVRRWTYDPRFLKGR